MKRLGPVLQATLTLVVISAILSASAVGSSRPSRVSPTSTALPSRRHAKGSHLAGLSVMRPYSVRAVWRLPWPYNSTHDRVIAGGLTQATIIMGSPSRWLWVALPGGPLWRDRRGQRPRVVMMGLTSLAPVSARVMTGGIQTGNDSALWTYHDGGVRHKAWPVPFPLVQDGSSGPLSVGAESGIARTRAGAVVVMGGAIAHPAVPATAYDDPGLLAPLFHPILATITPSGRLVSRVVLTQMLVGGVSGLAQGADGTVWFGVNTGRYEVNTEIYRGMAELVHWNPSSGRLTSYPLPPALAYEALVDQIVTRGPNVWASLQYSLDESGGGRAPFLMRLNTRSHRWASYPILDGSVNAWTVTPTGTVVAIVQPFYSPMPVLEIGHRIVAETSAGDFLVGVAASGSRVYLVVSGPHQAWLVAIASK